MIENSIYIAIIAFVYVEIMTSDEMIFGSLKPFICKLPAIIHKPFFSCSYCVAGQFGFWYNWRADWFEWILAVCLPVFFVHIFLIINERIQR